MGLICHQRAAVSLIFRRSIAIIITFLFSFFCLLAALLLSWSGKPDAPYFLITAYILILLVVELCTQRKVKNFDVVSLVKLLKP